MPIAWPSSAITSALATQPFSKSGPQIRRDLSFAFQQRAPRGAVDSSQTACGEAAATCAAGFTSSPTFRRCISVRRRFMFSKNARAWSSGKDLAFSIPAATPSIVSISSAGAVPQHLAGSRRAEVRFENGVAQIRVGIRDLRIANVGEHLRPRPSEDPLRKFPSAASDRRSNRSTCRDELGDLTGHRRSSRHG